jgi:Ca2+/H+ antiporter
MLKKKENVRNLISMGVYSVTTLIFLIQVFIEGSLTQTQKENFIGYPLIVFVSILIIANYVISMMDTFKGCKKRCKVKEKRPEGEAEGNTTGQEIEGGNSPSAVVGVLGTKKTGVKSVKGKKLMRGKKKKIRQAKNNKINMMVKNSTIRAGNKVKPSKNLNESSIGLMDKSTGKIKSATNLDVNSINVVSKSGVKPRGVRRMKRANNKLRKKI